MENILYLTTGFLWKLLDDYTDNNVNVSESFIEFVKIFLTAFTSMSYLKNPDMDVFFILTAFQNYICGALDTPFWQGVSLLPFIAFPFHISYYLNLSSQKLLYHSLIFVFLIGIMHAESMLFKEEMSLRKYISRIVLFSLTVIGAYLSSIVPGFEFIVPITLFYIGYFFTNLVFHFPTIYKQVAGQEIPVLKKEKDKDETTPSE